MTSECSRAMRRLTDYFLVEGRLRWLHDDLGVLHTPRTGLRSRCGISTWFLYIPKLGGNSPC